MEQESILQELSVSNKFKTDLQIAAKWAKILAVIGFVNATIALFTSIAQGSFLMAIVIAAISVFININLFNFGNKTNNAINNMQQDEFTDGLNYLRTYYVIYGILVICALVIVVISVLFSLQKF